jgi:twitching motility protein PilT
MNITELLTFAHKSGASDAHITSGEPPRVPIDGDIKRLKHDGLSPEEVHDMVFDIMLPKRGAG